MKTKNKIICITLIIITTLLTLTNIALADSSTKEEVIEATIRQGYFYDVDNFKEYQPNSEVPEESCQEIDINAPEWFYYYSYKTNKKSGGEPDTVQFKLAYIFDEGTKKKIIWINNQKIKVDSDEVTLETHEFKSIDKHNSLRYLVNYNFKVDKGTCNIKNDKTNENKVNLKPTIEIEDNQQQEKKEECPQETNLYNPCRQGQLICMEKICGVRTLVNEFINLRVQGISYLDLHFRSLDTKTSGLALYEEALGYKKIAEIKKDYELKAKSSKTEKIENQQETITIENKCITIENEERLCWPIPSNIKTLITDVSDTHKLNRWFGAPRQCNSRTKNNNNKYRLHAGTDLIPNETKKSRGIEVYSIEEGVVTNIINFYNDIQEDTISCAVLIYNQKNDRTFNYGEIGTQANGKCKDIFVNINQKIDAGTKLGLISTSDMLHLEQYNGKKTTNEKWLTDNQGLCTSTDSNKLNQKPEDMKDPATILKYIQDNLKKNNDQDQK
jgi:murein DD-endopeptidase MepM/ murein hydrolase activator NlpD